MLTFENQVTISRPLPEVFEFVVDSRNNPKWNYFVLQVERCNDVIGVGAEYLQTRKSDQQKFRVVEFIINEYCAIQTLPGERPAVKRALRFSGDQSITTVQDRVELHVPLPEFLSPVLTARTKSAVMKNLRCLAELLEKGFVILEDGRTVRL
ncbi:MAG: hypothetical protein AAGG55_11900 [Pseudomonadota bacterium]